MDESLSRWLGWAVAVLLMLGAIGSFHSGYLALGRVLVLAEEWVLRDDSYHADREPMEEVPFSEPMDGEPSSENRAGVPFSRHDGIQALFADEQEGAVMQMTGICSGDAVLALWMRECVEEKIRPPILVDGNALETLDPGGIDPDAAYRMLNRISSKGRILGTAYEKIH